MRIKVVMITCDNKRTAMAIAKLVVILREKTITNIKQNLFWAFRYNVLGIPVAMECYTYLEVHF